MHHEDHWCLSPATIICSVVILILFVVICHLLSVVVIVLAFCVLPGLVAEVIFRLIISINGIAIRLFLL